VKDKIIAAVKSDDNPDGYLIQTNEKYLDCLTLKIDELEEFFKLDEAHWIE